MASGYGFSSRGRGRMWRDDKHTATLQYQKVEESSYNADIQNPFGITQEPWSFYRTSTGGLDEPFVNHYKFENDEEPEEEEEVNFQKTHATKDVMNILSSTCRYLTDTDSLSSSTCDEVADQIFTTFGDSYNSFTSITTARHHEQVGAVGKTSTDSVKNGKQSAHLVKDSPVNKLEKVSTYNKLPAPSYALVSRKSAQGFIAVCEFLDHVATGYGNSENEAREEAAIKMLKELHIRDDFASEYDYEYSNSLKYNITKEEDQSSLQNKTQNECKAPHLQQSNSAQRGLEHCQKEQFQLKPNSGSHSPFPEFCMRPTGNKQYVWLLQSLASKMNFEVKYEIMPHRTSNCLAQCLVHLCKDPPIVCYGSAKSENKAKSSAARCAFEYLKIVYQK